MGRVIMRFALFPMVILPRSSDSSMAAAPFRVLAAKASPGVISILMQARLTMKFILEQGLDPGLKSVAKARIPHLSII